MTVALDATIIESSKREAQPTYQGGSGYQPMLALWAEMNLVLADEFHDGNVPTQKEPLRVARRAFQALPPTVGEYYFRGDSACWEKQLLNWLRDEQRADGPKGPITFDISVRMTPNLKKHMVRLGESLWKPYREDAGMVSECADLLKYWPEDEERPEGTGPLRYIAIRMRKRQGELLADGSEMKYFAVGSNQWDRDAARLLEWQREKAGTIEALHDVLKNELAAGVMPCGRFGANAAWLRLAVITHTVLTALKRLAMPEKWLTGRPKRMRFQVFCLPGKLVSHARQTWLRVSEAEGTVGGVDRDVAVAPDSVTHVGFLTDGLWNRESHKPGGSREPRTVPIRSGTWKAPPIETGSLSWGMFQLIRQFALRPAKFYIDC